MVVSELSRLHALPESTSLIHVLAISARGLPVITASSWQLARGDFSIVPKESVIRHRPLAMVAKLSWKYDALFEAQQGNAVSTIVELCRLPKKQVEPVWFGWSGRWR